MSPARIWVIAFWRKDPDDSKPSWFYLMSPPREDGSDLVRKMREDPTTWGPSKHIGNAAIYAKRGEAVAVRDKFLQIAKTLERGLRKAIGTPEILEVGGLCRPKSTRRELCSEKLLKQVAKLQDDGALPTHVTREQLIDFAYGNTSIENEKMTREIAAGAVDALLQANPSSNG